MRRRYVPLPGSMTLEQVAPLLLCRAQNALMLSEFETVADVRAAPDEALLAIPHLGAETLASIRRVLDGTGFERSGQAETRDRLARDCFDAGWMLAQLGIERAHAEGRPVERRRLEGAT